MGVNTTLLTVSKFCSEVMQEAQTHLNRNSHLRPFADLEDAIYDNSPNEQADLVAIYWKYSPEEYFPVTDYMSYMAAMILSAERRFYLLLHDFDEPWQDNGAFLKALESMEVKAEREKHRDIYDVKIKRSGDPDSDVEDEKILVEADNFVPAVKRTDFEVIDFAMRHSPRQTHYTTDCDDEWILFEDVKKGIPKDKKKLIVPAEEVIERVRPKADKKDKKNKKGKKKDKKEKKDKKKGGKKK